MKAAWKFIGMGAGAVALVIGGAIWARDGRSGPAEAGRITASATGRETPSIRVSGHGTVKGTPDTLTISMGVETRSSTANAALDDANARARALIDALKGAGVEAKNLQTQGLSVSPSWDKDGKVDGFVASNTVTAVLKDLDRAGSVIDAAADAAGDAVRINGISFSIEDTSDLVAQARADAVRKAKDQASQLADAAEVGLGAIVTIDEVSRNEPAPLYYDTFAAADRAESGVPIETGQQELSIDVEIVFAIEQ